PRAPPGRGAWPPSAHSSRVTLAGSYGPCARAQWRAKGGRPRELPLARAARRSRPDAGAGAAGPFAFLVPPAGGSVRVLDARARRVGPGPRGPSRGLELDPAPDPVP